MDIEARLTRIEKVLGLDDTDADDLCTPYKKVWMQVKGQTPRAYTTKERQRFTQLEQDFGREEVMQAYRYYLQHPKDYDRKHSVGWFYNVFNDVVGDMHRLNIQDWEAVKRDGVVIRSPQHWDNGCTHTPILYYKDGDHLWYCSKCETSQEANQGFLEEVGVIPTAEDKQELAERHGG